MSENIRMVLVRTSHPGNIGAAARAMKTMRLEKLYLVSPKVFPSEQAIAMAAGADDILTHATLVPSINEAIADCSLVMGASIRSRSLPLPIVNAREAASIISSEFSKHQTAILFGNERTGLEADELKHCHYQLQIPANQSYSSLNLAAAVQIVAYEILMSSLYKRNSDKNNSSETDDQVTSRELNYFYEHLQQVLTQVNFIKTGHPNRMMQRLRRVFNRARLDKTEMNILRGILSEVQRSLGHKSD